MTGVWMGMMKMVLFNSMFMSGLTFDMRLVKVHPKQAISGVSEASIGNQYALNASSARDLCEHLGLTIANKAQLAEAQKHGLETCRFGWIDEQIAVVPRVQVNPNCGNGKTGVVVWRAIPSKQFDVFCFNVTDFETQASVKAHRMTTRKPMTTRLSVAPTAGVHPRGSPLPKIPSHWSNAPPSAGPSVVHRPDDAKHLALSSVSTEAVPATLLITVTFAVMIAVFLALYYVRTKRPCKAQCDVEQQKEYIETEVWEHRTKEDLQKTQEEQVEEINQEEQMEEKNQEEQMEEKNQEKLEEKHQEEQMEEGNQEKLEEKHQEEQMEETHQEEHMEKNQEEQVEENDSSSAEH